MALQTKLSPLICNACLINLLHQTLRPYNQILKSNCSPTPHLLVHLPGLSIHFWNGPWSIHQLDGLNYRPGYRKYYRWFRSYTHHVCRHRLPSRHSLGNRRRHHTNLILRSHHHTLLFGKKCNHFRENYLLLCCSIRSSSLLRRSSILTVTTPRSRLLLLFALTFFLTFFFSSNVHLLSCLQCNGLRVKSVLNSPFITKLVIQDGLRKM